MYLVLSQKLIFLLSPKLDQVFLLLDDAFFIDDRFTCIYELKLEYNEGRQATGFYLLTVHRDIMLKQERASDKLLKSQYHCML